MKFIFRLILFSLFLIISSCGSYKYIPGNLANRKINIPQQVSVKENFWKISESIDIFFQGIGKGKKVLIVQGGYLIPSVEIWDGLKDLESNFRFYYYHQRACGNSTRPIDKFKSKSFERNSKILVKNLGIEALVTDIEKIRRILGEEKITLIGHSAGALIATLYALEFPENIDTLILVSPINIFSKAEYSYNFYNHVKETLPKTFHEEYDEYIHNLFNYKYLFFKNELLLNYLNTEFTKYFSTAILRNKSELKFDKNLEIIGGWQTHALHLSLTPEMDLKKYFNKIKASTLIIYGENDVSPKEVALEFQKFIPNSILKIIPNSGHYPFNENPDAFLNVIRNFLKNNE
ncbi:MAG: alpha/beta fold hydrolase [Bacteroidetes bacterium]|jgi:proline iminopeptidase|nr:alpha/beta fold hydrolase [Bacteroidota bacterium]MBT6686066.1 alpha/beta fold hydrolase [Bacteroidota bacterium]MBT7144310.1 alpha/beta fold hydrolase [Bacteroidota bacterium]MBT7490377.1 alpha/beta fold hydrolase [Bacteroidota bacterium]